MSATRDSALSVSTDEGSSFPLQRLFGLAGIVGPLLVIASSILWVTGGDEARFPLEFHGATFTGLGLLGLCAVIASRMPRAAAVLAVFAILGFSSGGAGFAIDGLHEEVFGSGSLADEGGIAGKLAPAVPGLLGPLSLIGIGIALLRTKLAAAWSGAALVAAGVLFPISRIGEIPPLAVVVDVLIIVSVVPLAMRMWQGRPFTDA